MLNLGKTLSKLKLKKEKVLFCYFEPPIIDYTPLDIGYISTLLKKNGLFKKYTFEIVSLKVFPDSNPEKVSGALLQAANLILTKDSQVVFFFLDDIISSMRQSMGIAQELSRRIKEKNPRIFIGFQSYKLESWQLQKIFSTRKVNCVIGDDPENSFLLLDKILKKEKVLGVSRGFSDIWQEKTVRATKDRKEDDKYLDKIPSPYLSGILDNMLDRKKEETGRGFTCFLQSARGCPFGCYYCPRSVKFKKVRCFSAKRFYDEVEYLVSRFGFFRFFVIDDTFLFSKERLRDFQREFKIRKAKNKKLENLHFFIMTRVEILDEEAIEILRNLGVVEVQVGLQTVNPKLQYYMNRKVKMEKFSVMAEKLEEKGIKLFMDIIGGLPGDSVEWFKKTVDFTLSLRPNRVQIKQLFFTSGTLFSRQKEKFGIKTQKNDFKFAEPLVVAADGINEEYNAEVYDYAEKKLKEHPETEWLISSERKNTMTPNFILRF